MNIKSIIETIPNWPKPGVNFLDITPILADPEAFAYCTQWIVSEIHRIGATSVVAVESRGFVFGAPAARYTNIPLILVRKAGKLPGNTYSVTYDTEYSTDTLEIKSNAIPGIKPIIIDDLLATGGTIMATANLLRKNFNRFDITALSIINLNFLPGHRNLQNNNIKFSSLVNYD